MPTSLGDVEGMIERKLAAGIELTIVGSPVGAGAMVPRRDVDNYAQSDDELRAFHDWLAEQVEAHAEHLRALVYVNPYGGERHLQAAAETYREGGFVGFIINTSVAGRYLDDPRAADFFAMASELRAPVMLHAPAQPAAGAGLSELGRVEQLGRFCDVTVGVACCILHGWLERYPDLELIATGGGGGLALLPEKLDLIYRAPHWSTSERSERSAAPWPRRAPAVPLEHPPSHYLRRVWVDTASPSATAMRANLEVFGADRMLLGTDSPPLAGMETPVLAAVESLPIGADAKNAVRGGNAARLFRL